MPEIDAHHIVALFLEMTARIKDADVIIRAQVIFGPGNAEEGGEGGRGAAGRGGPAAPSPGIIALHLDADHKVDRTERFSQITGGSGILNIATPLLVTNRFELAERYGAPYYCFHRADLIDAITVWGRRRFGPRDRRLANR